MGSKAFIVFHGSAPIQVLSARVPLALWRIDHASVKKAREITRFTG
jgi:hypothetical protein